MVRFSAGKFQNINLTKIFKKLFVIQSLLEFIQEHFPHIFPRDRIRNQNRACDHGLTFWKTLLKSGLKDYGPKNKLVKLKSSDSKFLQLNASRSHNFSRLISKEIKQNRIERIKLSIEKSRLFILRESKFVLAVSWAFSWAMKCFTSSVRWFRFFSSTSYFWMVFQNCKTKNVQICNAEGQI